VWRLGFTGFVGPVLVFDQTDLVEDWETGHSSQVDYRCLLPDSNRGTWVRRPPRPSQAKHLKKIKEG
jgi:hypothetical protein